MKGEVVYLYAFDVASEIVTAQITDVLGARPVPFEVQTDRALPRDVSLYKPLSVELSGPHALLGGSRVRVVARIYDVGVVSIIMRVSVEAASLSQLAPLHKPVLEDGRSLLRGGRRRTIGGRHDRPRRVAGYD